MQAIEKSADDITDICCRLLSYFGRPGKTATMSRRKKSPETNKLILKETLFMKYRKLGRTGFNVSDVAYGLWGMSGWSGSDDQQSLDSLQLAVDSHCNFFDSAWAYGAQLRQAPLCRVENSSRQRQVARAPEIQIS